jgi:hypothetical protein
MQKFRDFLSCFHFFARMEEIAQKNEINLRMQHFFSFFAAVQQSANPIDVERRFALQRKIFLKIAHTYIPNPPSSWLVRSVRAVQRTFIISKSEEKE